MGRSRGGLITKIHALVNELGLPIRFHLTPGQDHDAPVCRVLLDQLQPGQSVLADKAYDADWVRNMIWEQGAIDVIPSKSNRKIPKEFDAEFIELARSVYVTNDQRFALKSAINSKFGSELREEKSYKPRN